MIQRKKFKEQLILAESGDETAIAVVREVLCPLETDTVEEIEEKLYLFMRLVYLLLSTDHFQTHTPALIQFLDITHIFLLLPYFYL